MASNFYREQDGPHYYMGHGLELGFAVVGFVSIIVLRLSYQRVNRIRDERGTAGLTLQEMGKMGDRAPTYRYML